MTSAEQLTWAVQRIAQMQGIGLDPLRTAASLVNLNPNLPALQQLAQACQRLGIDEPALLNLPDRVHLPMICHTATTGWGVVTDRNPQGEWIVLNTQGEHLLGDTELQSRVALLKLDGGPAEQLSQYAAALPSFSAQVKETLGKFRVELIEAGLASAFIGTLALATSLFSMQVYDRVIPTRSEYTLAILSLGVLLSILIELAMKYARSHLMDYVVVGVDNRLSREVFQRFLQLRVDQIPASVGSLAGQMRGYEQVRSFYTATTLFTLIDLPMGILFLVVMMFVGSPWVATVPLVFGIIALYLGLAIRKKITQLATDGAALSNMKTGLLVEAVEGIETIKAGSGGWKFLSRWISVNSMTIKSDLRMRTATESVGYLSATIQQISYAGLVVVGSVVVMQGQMTMGALIACSILSGRILAPIMAVTGMLVQQAHAKAAMQGLEKIYELKTDNHGVDRPLVPRQIKGYYSALDVQFSYGDNPPALVLPKLEIKPGECIAILGPIGAGKSTLLRLLTGLYHPQKGRILLDGLDLAHISRQVINQHIGYLQQDHRLFQGTLRENLLIGLPDPGYDAMNAAMQRTGMDRFVSAHPKGLDRAISEGGKGLSGGQRQLVAFTRLILCNPNMLLLDEPTATMDDEQERRCLQVLAEEVQAGKTLLVVTHKPSILPLVSRIIVIAGNSIVADGPRDAVLQQLNAPRT
jgi:ATP-binding cassette subfamily C protein LapB